eukprot:scaffold33074_cov101-Isochrysis_galbana.AAC.1
MPLAQSAHGPPRNTTTWHRLQEAWDCAPIEGELLAEEPCGGCSVLQQVRQARVCRQPQDVQLLGLGHLHEELALLLLVQPEKQRRDDHRHNLEAHLHLLGLRGARDCRGGRGGQHGAREQAAGVEGDAHGVHQVDGQDEHQLQRCGRGGGAGARWLGALKPKPVLGQEAG